MSQTQDADSQDEEEAELLANVRSGPQRRSSGASAAAGAGARRTKLPTVEEASNETSAEASRSTESAAAMKPRRSRRST